MGDNGAYAEKENFLHQKQLKKCSNMFVQKNGKNDKKKFLITPITPCDLCENQACTYYICGECYKRELVSSTSSGVSSCRSNNNKLEFLFLKLIKIVTRVMLRIPQIHQLEELCSAQLTLLMLSL